VTTANVQEQLVSPAIAIEQPGYIYISLYNRSNSTNFVYFDDLTVTQAHSRVVVGSDFYPFGLAMDGTEITDEAYRYGYQGQFSEKDLTTGWNEFELRMYDARFGRWLSVDPYGIGASPYIGMANQPHMRMDPDGGCPGPPCIIGPALAEVVVTAAKPVASGLASGLASVGVGIVREIADIAKAGVNLAGSLYGNVAVQFDPNAKTFSSNGIVKHWSTERQDLFYEGLRTGGETVVISAATAGAGTILKPVVAPVVKAVKPLFKVHKTAAAAANTGVKVSSSTLDDAASMTMKQKGTHIFDGKLHPKPYLKDLAQQVGGEENLVRAALEKANGRFPASGIFELPVNVGGIDLTIRGFMNNGKPIINTIF
jgi:RHS repeat-associated protein